MCKLTESLRVKEFLTAEGRTFKLGLDEHKKIKRAVVTESLRVKEFVTAEPWVPVNFQARAR